MTNTAVVAVIRGMARSLMASDERGYSVPAMREDIPCGDQMIECRERERGDDGSTRKCSRRERDVWQRLWRQNIWNGAKINLISYRTNLIRETSFWAPIRKIGFHKIFDKIQAIRFFGSFRGH